MALKITPPRAIAAASLLIAAGCSVYYYRTSRNSFNGAPATAPSKKAASHDAFKTLFAVPLSCDGCIKSVSDSLYKLDGITKVEGNLKDQLILVEGTTAPSAIVEAIQATGRDAILRGSGSSDGAAVSILETFAELQRDGEQDPNREVRGLARMVHASPTRTLVDLTIRGVAPGTYRASIRAYGDLKDGVASTGPIWKEKEEVRGDLGVVEVGSDGRGASFAAYPFQVWEIIGHALVLTRQEEGAEALTNDEDTVVGVIARSAGVWDNDKTVCSCTGKTLWEERRDEVKKGML